MISYVSGRRPAVPGSDLYHVTLRSVVVVPVLNLRLPALPRPSEGYCRAEPLGQQLVLVARPYYADIAAGFVFMDVSPRLPPA